VLTGLRPYVPGAKPCVLAEPHPGLWVVTGGAKNGTAAAGWAARKLSEALS
jgi:glycine/D-amino acid oxidase-like deaminating enzyme